MKLTQFPIVLVTGAILAAQSPEAARAQAVAFPVEEATIADIEAAYLSGRTTARAVTQAHLDRIAA
jgi:amidase